MGIGAAKKMNGYAEVLAERFYRDTPKAVFAAIAVSTVSNGGDYLIEAEQRILAEWWVLFDNGIVPQKPNLPRPPEQDNHGN